MPNKLTPRYCVCKYAKLHAEQIELNNKRHKSLASPLKPKPKTSIKGLKKPERRIYAIKVKKNAKRNIKYNKSILIQDLEETIKV